jgi:hypothetical protein
MSSNDPRPIMMDSKQLYREDTYTDRRIGTVRKLIPVTAEGVPDGARQALFVGQAQIMTPMGALPISFEIEATTLDGAIAKFGPAAEAAVQQTMKELQEMRREQASSLVIPDAGTGAALGANPDLLRGGRPRR